MKHLKVLVMLFLAISILGTACKKDDDDDKNPGGDQSFKGSASLTIDGVNYTKILSNVAEIPEGVVFLMENSVDGTTFTVALANVPAIGVTASLDLNNSDDSPAILITELYEDVIALIGGSGTLKRVSEKEYEIDAIMYGGMNFSDEYPITGTVKVGVIEN